MKHFFHLTGCLQQHLFLFVHCLQAVLFIQTAHSIFSSYGIFSLHGYLMQPVIILNSMKRKQKWKQLFLFFQLVAFFPKCIIHYHRSYSPAGNQWCSRVV
jgi:hypothetical protein